MKGIAQRLLIVGVVIVGLLAGAVVSYSAPFAYIPNCSMNEVMVIDQQTNKIVTTIDVGSNPFGVAVNSAGSRVYVTNKVSDSVSVIDGTTRP